MAKKGFLSRLFGRGADSDGAPTPSSPGANPTGQVGSHEPIPELESFESIGAFAIVGDLTLGEHGYGDDGYGITVRARPGVWYAYFLDMEDVDFDDDESEGEEEAFPPSQLVVMHHSVHGNAAALMDSVEPLDAELPISGASMAVVDAAVAKDPEFQRDLEYIGMGIIQERGVKVGIGGDGHGFAYVARRGDEVVYARVDLL